MSFIRDPRYDKGRWYRIFIESDGSSYKVHNNTITEKISENHLKFKKAFHVVTLEIDYTFTKNSGASVVESGLYLYADSTLAVNLVTPDKFTSACMYVFGYEV